MSTFNHAPLTLLSDEEKAFADEIYKFAQREVAPHVMQMDEESKLNSNIVPKLFEMGLMGIEIPEKYDGVAGDSIDQGLAEKGTADGQEHFEENGRRHTPKTKRRNN